MPKRKQDTETKTLAHELGVVGKEKPDKDPNDITEQAETFNPFSGEITTIEGEKIKIPKLAFGKNLLIGKIIENLVDDFKAEKGVNILELKLTSAEGGGVQVEDLKPLISFVASFVPRKIAEIAGVILNQKYEWVLENLEEEQIIVVLMGFFGRKAAMARLLLQAAIGGFVSTGTNSRT